MELRLWFLVLPMLQRTPNILVLAVEPHLWESLSFHLRLPEIHIIIIQGRWPWPPKFSPLQHLEINAPSFDPYQRNAYLPLFEVFNSGNVHFLNNIFALIPFVAIYGGTCQPIMDAHNHRR